MQRVNFCDFLSNSNSSVITRFHVISTSIYPTVQSYPPFRPSLISLSHAHRRSSKNIRFSADKTVFLRFNGERSARRLTLYNCRELEEKYARYVRRPRDVRKTDVVTNRAAHKHILHGSQHGEYL